MGEKEREEERREAKGREERRRKDGMEEVERKVKERGKEKEE